jgi:hypothetical protein
VHPNGAKVCSTGKASDTPHTFGITFIRSGPLLADEQQPPTDTSGSDMTFVQAGQTLGALKVEVAGPAWASVEPTGPQAPVIAKLAPGPVTIQVVGRQYQADLTGLPDALAQLSTCETQAGQ